MKIFWCVLGAGVSILASWLLMLAFGIAHSVIPEIPSVSYSVCAYIVVAVYVTALLVSHISRERDK